MSEKIQAKTRLFGDNIMSVSAVVAKGATAPANDTIIPAGYPVMSKGDGTYEVFTKGALPAIMKGTTGQTPVCHRPLGILMEPVKLASTMTAKVKVAYAGDFYLDGLREATGILATEVADFCFIEADGHLNAVLEDKKEIYALV